MDKLISFITILAWIIGIMSLWFTIAASHQAATYSDLEKWLDIKKHGGTFRYAHFAVKCGFIFVICLVWIIVFW